MDIKQLLTTRAWTLTRPNGDIRSAHVRFAESGLIEGYDHPNEAFWTIERDTLVFLDDAGSITARSDGTQEVVNQAIILTMMRDGVVAHLLRENLVTDRPSPLIWADGERFRFRLTQEINAILAKYRVFSSANGMSRWKIGQELTARKSYCIQSYVGIYNDSFIPDIGSFSYIYSSAAPFHKIGRYCSISWNVRVMGSNHPTTTVTSSELVYQKNSRIASAFGDFGADRWQLLPNPQKGPPQVGNDVWIGQDVLLSQGVTLGTGCVIAAGAVVTKNVQPYEIVGGAPARHIRFRFSESIRDALLRSEWWKYAFPHIAKLGLDDPEAFLKSLEQSVRSGQIQPWETRGPNLFELVKDTLSDDPV
jgi:acetyltransferase-like isoleucine patch superfamily enzyme